MSYMLEGSLFSDPAAESDFACIICRNVFVEPLVDDCPIKNHTYCKQCIFRHLDHNQSCPISKIRLNKERLRPDLETIAAIGKFSMKCPYFANKCHWVGLNKELETHLSACNLKYGLFSTLLADFETSGGNFDNFNILNFTNDFRDLRLLSISIEFTDQFNEGNHFYTAFSGFTATFAFKNNEGVEEVLRSPKRGRPHSPANWVTKSYEIEIPAGKRLLGMFLGLGNRFFPSVGVLVEGDKAVRTFGYPALRRSVIPLVVPPKGIVTGFSGKSGWLIDSFAINYFIPRSN